MATHTWPVLRSFDAAHLDRIALPLGGIGTGTISLGGRGDLRDFELGNRPAKGFRPATGFFAVRARAADGSAQALVVEGPLPLRLYEGAFGSPAANHGLPRFADAEFDAAYPFGQVRLSDAGFPVRVTLQGFNPLVFGEVDRSSLPVAVLRQRLVNPTESPVEATVALSLSNFVGANGTEDLTGGNVNRFRDGADLAGITMTAPGLDPAAESAGEFTLALIRPGDRDSVSHRLGWADLSWGNSLLDFWDDLLDDGRLEPRTSAADRPVASLAGSVTLPPGAVADLTFLLSWSFPNRRAWRSTDGGGVNDYADDIVGGPADARILLDPGRLGRRHRRGDGGRPAQHDGRRVLRPQPAAGRLVSGGAASQC